MANQTAQSSKNDVNQSPPARQPGIVEKARSLLAGQKDTANPAASPNPALDTSKQSTSVRGMSSVLDALAKKGLISEEDLKAIKFEAVTYNTDVDDIVQSKYNISADDLQRVKAEMHGVGFVDLSSLSIPHQVLSRIPKRVASQNQAVAYEESQAVMKVGMVDPLDLQKVQYLESVVGKKVDPYFASADDVRQIIDSKYGAEIEKEVDEALADVSDVYEVKPMQAADVEGSAGDAPVIRIVNMVLDYAAKHSASDIHIEPRETKISVRYRVDGVLSEKLTIPAELAGPVITRIKILANMRIDEHRVPQDGRFQVKVEERVIDIRASVVPSIYGEKVVMRLLEKGGGVMTLDQTGLRGPGLEVFNQQLSRTQGLILVTGPTGSGKTQTLASCLKIVSRPDINVMTLEDPVEIRIDGVNQVQVNSEVGLTFANGLRSFLRQDPDVIMVGEIRDAETAKLAIQAALTGHLVLATLHTNNAAGALPRLVDMGVESYLLSSTINVVLAQRLVRRLDLSKAEAYQADPKVLETFHKHLDSLGGVKIATPDGRNIDFNADTQQLTLYRPTSDSVDASYSGRVGIFEVLPVTDNIRRMIIAGDSAGEINTAATTAGMVTMVQDGLIKALEGATTLEEVLRVIN